jgi:hypothetical protein
VPTGTEHTVERLGGALTTNASFYLWDGPGAEYNWALLISLLGLAGLVGWAGHGGGARARLSWQRLALSVLVLWGASAAYFLTHRVTVHYYPFPATFGAVAALALGGLTLECVARNPREGEGVARAGPLRGLALVAALLPGLVALERAWQSRPRASLSPKGGAHRPPSIPAELTGGRAWVCAHLLTGTLWYYAEQPAQKITFAGARTRALVYRFIFARGEPLYVVCDCPDMQRILDEITQMGGALEPRGEVEACPYFFVRWPEGGPQSERLLNARSAAGRQGPRPPP